MTYYKKKTNKSSNPNIVNQNKNSQDELRQSIGAKGLTKVGTGKFIDSSKEATLNQSNKPVIVTGGKKFEFNTEEEYNAAKGALGFSTGGTITPKVQEIANINANLEKQKLIEQKVADQKLADQAALQKNLENNQQVTPETSQQLSQIQTQTAQDSTKKDFLTKTAEIGLKPAEVATNALYSGIEAVTGNKNIPRVSAEQAAQTPIGRALGLSTAAVGALTLIAQAGTSFSAASLSSFTNAYATSSPLVQQGIKYGLLAGAATAGFSQKSIPSTISDYQSALSEYETSADSAVKAAAIGEISVEDAIARVNRVTEQINLLETAAHRTSKYNLRMYLSGLDKIEASLITSREKNNARINALRNAVVQLNATKGI